MCNIQIPKVYVSDSNKKEYWLLLEDQRGPEKKRSLCFKISLVSWRLIKYGGILKTRVLAPTDGNQYRSWSDRSVMRDLDHDNTRCTTSMPFWHLQNLQYLHYFNDTVSTADICHDQKNYFQSHTTSSANTHYSSNTQHQTSKLCRGPLYYPINAIPSSWLVLMHWISILMELILDPPMKWAFYRSWWLWPQLSPIAHINRRDTNELVNLACSILPVFSKCCKLRWNLW